MRRIHHFFVNYSCSYQLCIWVDSYSYLTNDAYPCRIFCVLFRTLQRLFEDGCLFSIQAYHTTSLYGHNNGVSQQFPALVRTHASINDDSSVHIAYTPGCDVYLSSGNVAASAMPLKITCVAC